MNQTGKTKLRVESCAGYRSEETPIRFFLGEREIAISDVIDRWLDPAYRYFKVRGDDDGVYILRHDAESAIWEMTLFRSGKKQDIRLTSA